MEKERKERLVEEKYGIICYEPVGDSELVEIPTQSYEPDKFAHRDCFLVKLVPYTLPPQSIGRIDTRHGCGSSWKTTGGGRIFAFSTT